MDSIKESTHTRARSQLAIHLLAGIIGETDSPLSTMRSTAYGGASIAISLLR